MAILGMKVSSREVSIDSDNNFLGLSPSAGPRLRSVGTVPEDYTRIADAANTSPEETLDTARSGGHSEVGCRMSVMEREIHECLDFNESIYDLTVQYSCLAVHDTLGSNMSMLNVILGLMLQVLNVYMQMTMVLEVYALITVPAAERAQHLYLAFTKQCFGNDPETFTYSQEVKEEFNAWDDHTTKWELCQLPLRSPNFYFLILLIWTLNLGHELKQTIYLARLVLKLQEPAPGQGRVTILDQDDNLIISHISHSLKAWITLTVVVPKLAIAVFLWIIGAKWLTATSGFENLVLNALALTFICELDELIFRACISEKTKTSLRKTKLPLPPFTHAPNIWDPVETVWTCVSCIGLTLLYIYCLQDAIPNYRWDLNYFCRDSSHPLLMTRSVSRALGLRSYTTIDEPT